MDKFTDPVFPSDSEASNSFLTASLLDRFRKKFSDKYNIPYSGWIGDYSYGERSGYWFRFFSGYNVLGWLRETANMMDGKLHGWNNFYSGLGNITQRICYANGVKHGFSITTDTKKVNWMNYYYYGRLKFSIDMENGDDEIVIKTFKNGSPVEILQKAVIKSSYNYDDNSEYNDDIFDADFIIKIDKLK
jgi:antitoxin component YwqK of YwqJK toxin-antitoxin module